MNLISSKSYHKVIVHWMKFFTWFLLFNFAIILQASNVSTSCSQFCNIPIPWINQAKNICYGTMTMLLLV